MVFAKIHNLYNNLTKTEQKIASFVLASPDRVISMTAKELASEVETVPSAVIRFSRSIGYDGFSAFKIDIARSIGEQKQEDLGKMPAFKYGDSAENVCQKVFASSIQTLKDTLGMLDFEKTEKLCNAIKKAKRLFFMGVGTSSIIATDAQYRFSQLGISATACTDLVFMSVSAINLTVDDVVVFISHSGRTKAVVDAMRFAKKSGAKTIAITSFATSPLACESDYSLVAYADEENYPVEAVSARVAHICIIDALAMTIASSDAENFERHVVRRNRILRDVRY